MTKETKGRGLRTVPMCGPCWTLGGISAWWSVARPERPMLSVIEGDKNVYSMQVGQGWGEFGLGSGCRSRKCGDPDDP